MANVGTTTLKRFLHVETPIGVIRIEGDASLVTRLRLPGEIFSDTDHLMPLQQGEIFPSLIDAREWLNCYFAGEPLLWSTYPIPVFSGFTARVYNALLKVPFGATVSYGELAAMAGSPNAARAVGRAMATNPLAIFIPCHRVLGSDGSLHGYGGGLPMKRALLEHEGVIVK